MSIFEGDLSAAPKRNTAAPRVSIVIPAMNEALNLSVVLPQLPPVHEVILVDGGSVDGTVDTARKLHPGIVALRQSRRGKGNALATGFAAATGDIVVMFDADGSADPAEIPRFVEALVAGADFAKGTRFAAGGGSGDITVVRRVGNAVLNTVFNRAFHRSYSDLCYGYNALWTDLVPLLDLPDHRIVLPRASDMIWGDGFEIETVVACRLAAAEVAIVEVASYERLRMFGESNLRALSDGLRVLRTIGRERRRARVARRLERQLGRPAAVRASTRSAA